MTDISNLKIDELQALLYQYDYKHNKYIRGEYTDDEWTIIKSEIQAITARIRELKSQQ